MLIYWFIVLSAILSAWLPEIIVYIKEFNVKTFENDFCIEKVDLKIVFLMQNELLKHISLKPWKEIVIYTKNEDQIVKYKHFPWMLTSTARFEITIWC